MSVAESGKAKLTAAPVLSLNKDFGIEMVSRPIQHLALGAFLRQKRGNMKQNSCGCKWHIYL